jgi:hypothetical protein
VGFAPGSKLESFDFQRSGQQRAYDCRSGHIEGRALRTDGFATFIYCFQ